MRFAVISDIHSNYMALENALSQLDDMRRAGQGPDGMIFLGDYLTDFPYPQETLRLLDECRAEFPCHFVRGNREEMIARVAALNPILLEAIPLTLEEIFIYELGGEDYAVKDIVL